VIRSLVLPSPHPAWMPKEIKTSPIRPARMLTLSASAGLGTECDVGRTCRLVSPMVSLLASERRLSAAGRGVGA